MPSFTFTAGRFALPAVALLCLFSAAWAQKVDRGKLDAAERRAGKAAQVVAELAALPPDASIPKAIIERARAVAVFPDATKTNVLFTQKFWKGYGLMARRVEGGWGTPAFYGFVVHDRGWTRVKSDAPGVIMLIMDDETLKRFEKDGIQLEAAEGPVGELTPEKEKDIRGAGILMYALSGGELRGISVELDDTSQAGMNSDNNVNKAVYGLKAREVLWGKTPEGMAVPPAVVGFRNALASFSKQ